jgi:hypothetical protein
MAYFNIALQNPDFDKLVFKLARYSAAGFLWTYQNDADIKGFLMLEINDKLT